MMTEKEMRNYEAFVMSQVVEKYAKEFEEKSLIAYAKTVDVLRYDSRERVEATAELALLAALLATLKTVVDNCAEEVGIK